MTSRLKHSMIRSPQKQERGTAYQPTHPSLRRHGARVDGDADRYHERLLSAITHDAARLPTTAMPGTAERVAIYTRRNECPDGFADGLCLPGDATGDTE